MKNKIRLTINMFLVMVVFWSNGCGAGKVKSEPDSIDLYEVMVDKWDKWKKRILHCEIDEVGNSNRGIVETVPGIRFTSVYILDDRHGARIVVTVNKIGIIISVRISFYMKVNNDLTEYFGSIVKGNLINEKIAKIAYSATKDAKRYVEAALKGGRQE